MTTLTEKLIHIEMQITETGLLPNGCRLKNPIGSLCRLQIDGETAITYYADDPLSTMQKSAKKGLFWLGYDLSETEKDHALAIIAQIMAIRAARRRMYSDTCPR